jgi:hypothetical protein
MHKIKALSEESYVGKFIRFLENDVGIKKAYYMKEKQVEFRSLNGDEKLKVFRMVNLEALLPNIEHIGDIQKLWASFYEIYDSLRHGDYSDREAKANEIENATHEWFNLFVSVYQRAAVTPYIHTFAEHLHELIRAHGDISLFTMQGNCFY